MGSSASRTSAIDMPGLRIATEISALGNLPESGEAAVVQDSGVVFRKTGRAAAPMSSLAYCHSR